MLDEMIVKSAQSGVDYLTLTAVNGERSRELQEQVEQWISLTLPKDVIPKKWYFRGYKGLNYGPVRIGARSQDGTIVMT